MSEATWSVDVAIITVREDEFKALSNFFQNSILTPEANCLVVTHNGLEIAIAPCYAQRHQSAGELAKDLIKKVNPSWILVVGACGAYASKEVTLGDVVISSRISDFTATAPSCHDPHEFDPTLALRREVDKFIKLLSGSVDRFSEWDRGLILPSQDYEPRQASGGRVEKRIIEECIRALESRGGSKILFATSDNPLKGDSVASKTWREGKHPPAGMEQDLATVAQVVGKGNKRVLGIRSVSHIVGFNADPIWPTYACDAAAALVMNLLSEHADVFKKKERPRVPSANAATKVPALLTSQSTSLALEPIAAGGLDIELFTPNYDAESLGRIASAECLSLGRFPTRRCPSSSLLWLDSQALINHEDQVYGRIISADVVTILEKWLKDLGKGDAIMVAIDPIGAVVAGSLSPTLFLPLICVSPEGDTSQTAYIRKIDASIIAKEIGTHSPHTHFILVTDVLRTGKCVVQVIEEIKEAILETPAANRQISFHVISLVANSDVSALDPGLKACSKIWTCCNSIDLLVFPNEKLPPESILPPS